MNIRITPKLVAAAAAGTLLLGTAAAVASTGHPSASHHGKIEVWVSPAKGNSPVQKIMFTGAIGDYGKATSTTKSGKVDPNGTFVHIALQRGTIRVNATAFNRKLNQSQQNVNKTSCSIWETASGNVKILSGTGAYAGIGGTVRITASFAAVFPRHSSGPKKGQCKVGNKVAPVDTFESALTGGGTVTL